MTNPIHLPFLRTPTYLDRADEDVESVVKAWHDDVHDGSFHICLEQPCHAVNAQ